MPVYPAAHFAEERTQNCVKDSLPYLIRAGQGMPEWSKLIDEDAELMMKAKECQILFREQWQRLAGWASAAANF